MNHSELHKKLKINDVLFLEKDSDLCMSLWVPENFDKDGLFVFKGFVSCNWNRIYPEDRTCKDCNGLMVLQQGLYTTDVCWSYTDNDVTKECPVIHISQFIDEKEFMDQ